MITQRQKELATWFDNLRIGDFEFSEEWSGPMLDEDGNVTLISCFSEYVGPWLDADWCWEFLRGVSKTYSGYLEVNINNHSLTLSKSITEQLQESVKQVIKWLPEESLQVIRSILPSQPQTPRP